MAELFFKNWVKITMGKSRGDLKLMYYKCDLPWQLFHKWQWYFEYRAALLKVKNPRLMVIYEFGSAPYTPPKELLIKNLKNRITNKKGKITSIENKLKIARQNWNSIFPIESDPLYPSVVEKINRLINELMCLELELKKLEEPELK